MTNRPVASPGEGPPATRRPDLIPREYLRVIAIWSLVPAYAVAGAFIGWLIDRSLGSYPFGIGIGLLAALLLAVRDMMRLKDEFTPPGGVQDG